MAQTFRNCICSFAALMFVIGAPAISSASLVAYFTDFNVNSTSPAALITNSGDTPVHITDISTFAFDSASVFMLYESHNAAPPSSALLARIPDLTTWVEGGGIVMIHDRSALDNDLIPGGSGISLTRSLGTDLDVAAPVSALSNALLGSINNSTLDGGAYSDDGYADVSTLPLGAINFLSPGPDLTKSSAFGFPLGLGYVYYSTIPLDFYLSGGDPGSVADNFTQTYGANVSQLAATLLNAEPPVPEPTAVCTLAFMGLTAIGRRCRGGAMLDK